MVRTRDALLIEFSYNKKALPDVERLLCDSSEARTRDPPKSAQIQLANISTKGLFLNVDSGFDTLDFRSYCYVNEIFDNIDQNKINGNSSQSNTVFDELLYKTRFLIERTNAWLNAYKAILIRFKINDIHWKGLLLFTFFVILLRKL